MPQAPGLPIDEPVEKPQASPAQFGSVGATIAGMAEETEQLALGSQEVAGHLIAAQRQVRVKQAEIAFDKLKMQVYTDLNKTTSPEEAQAVYDHSKGELDNVLTPFEHDRVLARALGIYRQQEDLEIQGTVNAKKADILTKADKAANQTLGEKALQNAITTKMGGGDPSLAREQFNLQLESSVAHGTLLPQQRDAMMQKWDKDYQSGVLDAYANSPNPLVRRQVIDQLKTGKGPLDLSMLDQGERNQFLSHAEELDERLTHLAETQNLNVSLNNLEQTFKAPPYSDSTGTPNYENRLAALKDPNFLIANGIATVDPSTGKPIADFVMAEKLRGYVDASQTDYTRAAVMKADKIRDEVDDHFSKGDITGGLAVARQHQQDFQNAHVDYYDQAVNRARTWMNFDREMAASARAEARADRAEKRQGIEDRGEQTLGGLWGRISNGEILDYDKDVWDQVQKNQMTPKQASEIWNAYKQSQQDADYKNGLGIIASSSLDNATKSKTADSYTQMTKQNHLTGRAALDLAQKLTDDAGQSATGSFIQRLWNNIKGGGPIAAAGPVTSVPATIYARDPQGNLHQAPAGTKLPDGWKLEKQQ
jgi:hypothetical protein